MDHEPEDPWDGNPPWLHRPGPRVALALLATASLLGLTLMSTCSARSGPPPATTTTTLQAALPALGPC